MLVHLWLSTSAAEKDATEIHNSDELNDAMLLAMHEG